MINVARRLSHFSLARLVVTMFVPVLCLLVSLVEVRGLCGSSVKWSHHFSMEEVYGVWFGAGYFQHNPDMTNMPNEIGCLTLYIADATIEDNKYILSWPTVTRNYSDHNWLSSRNNPFSNTALAGSWLDISLARSKRDYDVQRVSVIWDEDGQTMEQIYEYAADEPGLWTVEQWRPMEKELSSRGIDLWYPDDLPHHPEVMRILKVSPDLLMINYCSDIGESGMFTLILHRHLRKIDSLQFQAYKQLFYSYELPNVYRHTAVCAACAHVGCYLTLFVCMIVFKVL